MAEKNVSRSRSISAGGMRRRPPNLTAVTSPWSTAFRSVYSGKPSSAAAAGMLKPPPILRRAGALAWGKGYQREPLFCFPSWAGAPMPPMDMTLRLRQVMRRAKVTGRQPTRGWRHTSATLLIHSGENVKTVQTRLGHSTPAITMALYVHPTEEADRSAADFLGSLLPPAKPPAQ